MLKKIISVLLTLLLLFSFTACEISQETVDLAADVALALLEETDSSEEEAVEEADPIEESQPEDTETVPSEDTAEEPEEASPSDTAEAQTETAAPAEEDVLAEDGWYTTKEDVALYLHLYNHLPDNFMTKKEARALGWEGGGLDSFADGMCIGGDRFGNYENLLPSEDGRTWTECDIDTMHANSRGAKRIVFSNDGLIYYTDDHYESFTLLYGEDAQ